MIKLSHEVPKCLLKQSLEFCDYQYALPHLLESDETYRNHFIQCSENGVEIYLDNSLHELGVSMPFGTLLKWVNFLRPSHFFIPDVWEDMQSSINNAIKWKDIKLPDNTTKIAVVQAKNIWEAKHCYLTYKSLGYKKIAFSYGASYYTGLSFEDTSKFQALGRINVISTLYDLDVIHPTDSIHLLGTAWPFEFSFYKNMPFITSLDTSNPIMAAIEGRKYTDTGIDSKPKMNMNQCFDISIDQINLDIINHNVNNFKKILNMNEKQEECYVSLYDALGHACGRPLGKIIKQVAASQNVKTRYRSISNKNYEGLVVLYPQTWLKNYLKIQSELEAEKVRSVFDSELGSQLNGIYMTSDLKCFIRREEAENYCRDILEEGNDARRYNIKLFYK